MAIISLDQEPRVYTKNFLEYRLFLDERKQACIDINQKVYNYGYVSTITTPNEEAIVEISAACIAVLAAAGSVSFFTKIGTMAFKIDMAAFVIPIDLLVKAVIHHMRSINAQTKRDALYNEDLNKCEEKYSGKDRCYDEDQDLVFIHIDRLGTDYCGKLNDMDLEI